MPSYKEQFREISAGAKEIILPEELEKKLFLSEKNNSPLIVKHGADPTASSLHIGHMIPIHKIKQFQDFGHKVIFLIGDFTARIGDPSWKSTKRKPLGREQVEGYMKDYLSQVFRVLDSNKTEIKHNSRWFEGMNVYNFINEIALKYTVAQLLSRDDFNTRFSAQKPIAISEFLYPLLQAYDSVMLKADVEVGGNDQLFNFMIARQLQEQFGQAPEAIITLPTIKGIDGSEKMSKSLGNSINLSDSSKDMYGKVMSISDELMMDYYPLLDSRGQEIVEEIKLGRIHPKKAKENLAQRIVSLYHNPLLAKDAKEKFDSQFSQKQTPSDLENILLKNVSPMNVTDMLFQSGKVKSKSEAKRLIQQRGIRINGETVLNADNIYSNKNEYTVNIGKRTYFKISFKNE